MVSLKLDCKASSWSSWHRLNIVVMLCIHLGSASIVFGMLRFYSLCLFSYKGFPNATLCSLMNLIVLPFSIDFFDPWKLTSK
ncbi:hypothetical protein F4824DRAFT_475592 [Ustulina deusta]|nr:hypothetical protein F4824DRAFT_475592 [Ustulina deusta]